MAVSPILAEGQLIEFAFAGLRSKENALPIEH